MAITNTLTRIKSSGKEHPQPEKIGKSYRYPFDVMEVGDFFFLPDNEGAFRTCGVVANRLVAASSHYARRDGTGKTFKSVKVIRRGEPFIRLQRTK